MKRSTAEIRQIFLDFFCSKGHQILDSSSLIPQNDKTLLFTNAGMNQFKELFIKKNKDYSKVATAQRCIRAGGKHNDLENVGYTTRHHTFFEMLGNFSFGDYFKKEAIGYAWELLTNKKWFNIPPDRLWITVYETDHETYNIWLNDIGICPERLICIGDNGGSLYNSDNFWQMGNTGPCGPCSEIFYDHGEHLSGNPPGGSEINGNRYVEIWNIVFIQFDRQIDGTMVKLPICSVDTGMGLERIAAVLQNVHSNYDIDLFTSLMQYIAHIMKISDLNHNSLRVIADHIRSCSFLIADGVVPANEGRGYVLRRIIRRAIRHGNKLGIREPFFWKLVKPLIEVMDITGKILQRKKNHIENILKIEEEIFNITLNRGLILLDKKLKKVEGNLVNGKIIFLLYDTFGLPIELIKEICNEKGLEIDDVGFQSELQKQRHRSRTLSNFKQNFYNANIYLIPPSVFKGYDKYIIRSVVKAIFVNTKQVEQIENNTEAIVILEETPFYGESGGQIGDTGILKGINTKFIVTDTQKYGQVIGHIGKLICGNLGVGNIIEACVDQIRRNRISANHSATHLLHAALRQVLGKHVSQKGSLVSDKYLRFDFFHAKSVELNLIHEIENIVNYQIRNNLAIKTDLMTINEAKKRGAIAIFIDKYEKYVRVLQIGEFSTELCGGTHVSYTGNIGLFQIIAESSVAAGIRRIEAVTGEQALSHVHLTNKDLYEICQLIKVDKSKLKNKIQSLVNHVALLERKVKNIENQQIMQETKLLLSKAISFKQIKLIVNLFNNMELNMLRRILINLKNNIKSGVIVLAVVLDRNTHLLVAVSKNLTDNIKACELVKMLAHQINGAGGGCSTIAEAKGDVIIALPEVLAKIEGWVKSRL